ncbi:MAG: hypothetical protein EBR08_01335, partial [Bacteroidia bacterium]|nr:hypothetical protein [Bacteroidia bacterium]
GNSGFKIKVGLYKAVCSTPKRITVVLQQSEDASSLQHVSWVLTQDIDCKSPQQKCKIKVLALSGPELSTAQNIKHQTLNFINQIYTFKNKIGWVCYC